MSLIFRQTILLFFATLIAIIIPLLLFAFVKFPLRLTPAEKVLVNFNSNPLHIEYRNWKERNLRCPVSVVEAPELKPAISAKIENVAAKSGIASVMPEPTLTFILFSGNDKDTAIIDGHLLKQGQARKGIRVIKVEQKKVLIEDKRGKRWLTME
jgi:hypothetical protein